MDTTTTSQQAKAKAKAMANPAHDAAMLIYVLHSGQMFGTERMAIATVAQLGTEFDSLLLVPPGGAIAHARSLNLKAIEFCGNWQLIKRLAAAFMTRRQVVLVATGVSHSLAGILLAAALGVTLRHIHVVHGGADERLSYGRKKWLRWFAVDFIAVSNFVRQRLIAHAVPAARIHVIENFLTVTGAPLRATFQARIVNAVVVSRLDPIKRVGLLLDALQLAPALSELKIDIYGSGWEQDALRARSAASGLNVKFSGFTDSVPAAMARADLLLHTCPEEPFGLVILEAMAAGIPVLVPDAGGPSDFITDGENGFTYRANDATHLAKRLQEIRAIEPQRINLIVAAAHATLRKRFSPTQRIADYRNLLNGSSRCA